MSGGLRIVRMANFVAPSSGGLRTALRELGIGYAAAGHEPILIVPGAAPRDEETEQGRVITVPGAILPGTGGYRVLSGRRDLARLLAHLTPDRLEIGDRTTLRWTGDWARRAGVPAVMVSHESVDGVLTTWHIPAGLSRTAADHANRRTARSYTRVVCTTEWAEREFTRVGAPNVIRAPLGVDLTRFHPVHHSTRLRDEYAHLALHGPPPGPAQPGPSGLPSASGASGPLSPSDPSGLPDRTGAPSATGAPGLSGAPGLPGRSAAPGSSGAPGPSGLPAGLDAWGRASLVRREYTRLATPDAVEAPVLLALCSRLSAEKRPGRALDALAVLRGRGIDAVLVVAGDGPLRSRMRDRARTERLPVVFAGHVADLDDLAAIQASADVVVAPGPAETFGLAALEALACGTPVVASARSAVPAILGPAGVAAADDGASFADGVLTLLSRSEPARRTTARTQAERYPWSASIHAFLTAHTATPVPEGTAP